MLRKPDNPNNNLPTKSPNENHHSPQYFFPTFTTVKNQYRDINPKSSSWITDASGSVNQHLQYMPFGEQFIDQWAKKHDIRFKLLVR